LNEIRFTLEIQGLKRQPLKFTAKREFPFQRTAPEKAVPEKDFQRDEDVPLIKPKMPVGPPSFKGKTIIIPPDK
jgi:hypothetical protein